MNKASQKQLIQLLDGVLYQGRSLQAAMPLYKQKENEQVNWSEVQANVYGILRHYQQLKKTSCRYLKKPLKKKDRDIELVLLSALYRLQQAKTPDYAVVNEIVQYSKKGKKRWAANLLNGVLRSYCRDKAQGREDPKVDEMPGWLQKQLKKDWPQDYDEIVKNSHIQADMVLRVNRQKQTTEAYYEMLQQAGIRAEKSRWVNSALVLASAVSVEQLPGFNLGRCSVQDSAAQLAAIFLDPQNGENILDACAAPGGKTGHIAELAPECKLTAVDIDAKRLARIQQNQARLGFPAQLKQADLQQQNTFAQNTFDRILLDAPCSALGVIRRHPDIKFLRKASDIEPLVSIQQKLLHNCWQWLKPGGVLLYATCSILKQENEQQIQQFLQQTSDARLLELEIGIQNHAQTGLQILPGENGMDGFYYAKVCKL